jgi:hypothetical protein
VRFADPPMPIGLRDDAGAVLQPDDEANFRQQWRRTTFSDGTFTLESRAIVARCLKPRETLAPTANDQVVLGSCSDLRARWRKEFAPGPGDLYVNVQTNHVLTPALCLIQCDARVRVFPRSYADQVGAGAHALELRHSVGSMADYRCPDSTDELINATILGHAYYLFVDKVGHDKAGNVLTYIPYALPSAPSFNDVAYWFIQR